MSAEDRERSFVVACNVVTLCILTCLAILVGYVVWRVLTAPLPPDPPVEKVVAE